MCSGEIWCYSSVETWWHTVTHGRGSEGETCEWSGWPVVLHSTSEHGASSITTADEHTSAASTRLNWPPANLNGLVHFAERPNLVSAHVPSRSERAIPFTRQICTCSRANVFVRICFNSYKKLTNFTFIDATNLTVPTAQQWRRFPCFNFSIIEHRFILVIFFTINSEILNN